MVRIALLEDLHKLASKFDAFLETIQPLFVRQFGSRGGTSHDKGGGDLVGETDLAVQERMIEFLTTDPELSGPRIVSEELPGEPLQPGETAWLLDPFDGTHNSLAGIPLAGAMIALIVDGIVMFTVVFLPPDRSYGRSGLYYAHRGLGAWEWADGDPIELRVSSQDDLSKAFLFIEGPSQRAFALRSNVHLLISATRRFRTNFSACWSMTRVASAGSSNTGIDILFTVGNKPWDNLPACLLIEEAGGRVTDHDGNPWSVENCADLICCNPSLHTQVLAVVNAARRSE